MSTVEGDQDSTSEIVSPDEDSGAKNVSHLESSCVALLTSDLSLGCEPRFTRRY